MQADIIRAKQRIETEHSRGLSLGAPNGVTLELKRAEAVLSVCLWRKAALLREKSQTRPAPCPCWGMNGLELVRQRAFMMGGWDEMGKSVIMGGATHIPAIATATAVAATASALASNNNSNNSNSTNPSSISKLLSPESGGICVLDFECESERVRRSADEFASKLELHQRVVDEQNNLNRFLTAAELRIKRERELAREALERKAMQIQDILSGLPPLSKPPPVQYIQSNEHTIWVSWERVMTEWSAPRPGVTYMLYARSEFQSFLKGDRVLVMPLEAAIRAEELRKDKMTHTYARSRAQSRLSRNSNNASRMANYNNINSNDFNSNRSQLVSRQSAATSVATDTENWKALEAAHGHNEEVKLFPGELIDSG